MNFAAPTAAVAAASLAGRRASKRTSEARRWGSCSDTLAADTDPATGRSDGSRSGSTIPIERESSSVARPFPVASQ